MTKKQHGGKREGSGRYMKSPKMIILKARIVCPHCEKSSKEIAPYAGIVFHCPVCGNDSRIGQKMPMQSPLFTGDKIVMQPILPTFAEAREILKGHGHSIRVKKGDNDNAYLDGSLVSREHIMQSALRIADK